MTQRRTLPNRRPHEVIEFEHDGLGYAAGIGRFDDGRLAEIFIDCAKQGCGAEAVARDSAILASIALQLGVPADQLRHSLQKLADGSAASPIGRALELAEVA